MWIIWQIISQEVIERNGLTPKAVSHQKFVERVFRLIVDLEAGWSISRSQILIYHFLNFGPYVLFAIAPFLLLWSWLDKPMVLLTTPWLMFGLLLGYHFWLKPKTIAPIFNKIIQKSIRRSYLRLWRGRFVQLLDATQASLNDLSHAIYEIMVNRHQQLTATTYLSEFVPHDLGIGFYSEAARFRS